VVLRNMMISPLLVDGRSAHPVHLSRSAVPAFTGKGCAARVLPTIHAADRRA
jgi:hypothetical protein